jgi:SAM-dependent methyltransferase
LVGSGKERQRKQIKVDKFIIPGILIHTGNIRLEKVKLVFRMPDSDDFWDFYWESHLISMENLGKRAAILAASKLIRLLAQQTNQPVRLLELGCGAGQIIGTLVDAHSQLCNGHTSVGVDHNAQSLVQCRRDFPGMRWVEGDFTNPDLLAGLGKFNLVLLVNALHEVFSAAYSPELGEVDVPVAKQRVAQALDSANERLGPGGWLLLFDGLEPPGDPYQKRHIRFLNRQAREEFDTFARQYRPFRIAYREIGGPLSIELSQRDFTRYITKSIFLGKHLWETERLESYQYFTEEEFRESFTRLGFEIIELRILTVNAEKWRYRVETDPSEAGFPPEHVLILAQSGLSETQSMAKVSR